MMRTNSYQYSETVGWREPKLRRGKAPEENRKPVEIWFLDGKEMCSLSLKWL